MNKLQKKLKKAGVQFKRDNKLPLNSVLFIQLLKDGKILDHFLGSAYDIYCRASGKDADSIALYSVCYSGRGDWGPISNTKRIIKFKL